MGRSWVMHRTGKYRRLNLIFGLFPFVAAILLSMMREDSPSVQLWFSIVSSPTCSRMRPLSDLSSFPWALETQSCFRLC